MALPIVSINNANSQSVVIDLADIFFTDFAELGFGYLDRSRTSWHKIKAFPNNIELEVEATFSGGGRRSMYGFGGDDGVADSRGPDDRHPLQPGQAPRARATSPATPTTASATS